MPLPLDISSFEKAVAKLEKVYTAATSERARADEEFAEISQMAAVQAFEFTYEQSFKMIRRFLEAAEPSPKNLSGETFQSIVRLASERGLLLNDLAAWDEYRKKRNITSHAYNEEKAQEVLEIIPDFIREVRYLRDQMNERISRI